MKRMIKAVSILLVACLVVVASAAGCAEEEKEEVKAGFTASPRSGTVPLEVQFTDQSTGDITDWEWDFDNDGTVDSTEQNPSYTYATAGEYTVSLAVTGPEGSDTATKDDYIEVSQKQMKIGVIGPMAYIQGKHHLYGAEMARDEINAAGGILVGDEYYGITLVDIDSNEIVSPTDAVTAMERLITVENVDFVVGGFRTESVLAMQDKAMEYGMIFLGCGASENELCTRVADDYDTYKYWFRVSPVNGTNLAKISFMLTGMVAQEVGALTYPEAPKIAILAENVEWADLLVATAQAYFAAPPPYGMGLTVVGTWRPDQVATDVTSELLAIEDQEADIIYTVVSGPLGVAYTRQWGELEIPAASVGINVEAQKGDFLEVTGGYGAYETTLNTYARVGITDETIDFYDDFVDSFGEIPIYTAGTYDAIYILKDAIERAGTLDSDAVVAALEATDMSGPPGTVVFMGTDEVTPHDLTWGPGYVTGVGVQWQDGELVCVWPNAGGALGELEYEGTVDYILPPWVESALTE
jgi:branched-chain amino acid transport system substrate-binding protein